MRRALCITPFSPLPPTEGHRKRILSTIGVLKRIGFTVDLLLLCRDYHWHRTAGEPQFAALREIVDSFHFVPGDYPTRDDDRDWGIDDWVLPSFDAYVKWLADRRNYDVVFCNYVFLSRVLTHFPASVCRILETHDKFGGRREMLQRNHSRLEFFYTTEQEEAAALERSDLVIAIKAQEGAYFRKLADRPVITLPYVEEHVDVRPGRRRKRSAPRRMGGRAATRSKGAKPIFGYFASSNWINRENFYTFVECYKNSQRFKDGERLHLAIYGSLCNIIEKNDDVYLSIGMVKDVAEVYEAIDCVVIPQEFSTGLKIKVSEALSFGVALISHTHALEGFPVASDSPMSCATFEDLVERCFEIQAKPKLLDVLRNESLAVQKALLEETRAAEQQIADFVVNRLPTVCVVADAKAIATDLIYFESLQCVASALSSFARVSLCLYGAAEMTIHEYESKGGHHVNEYWTAGSPEQIASWMFEGRAQATLVFTPDGELAERIGADSLGCPGQVFLFEDFCNHAAMVSASRKPALPDNCIRVGGRPHEQSPGLTIWHLRWLPWSLSFSGALAHHTVSERGFVFIRARNKSNVLLCERLEVVSLDAADPAMSMRDFVRLLLAARIKPRFVVDDAGLGSEYRLVLEMLHLNGVPILSTSEEDRDFLYSGGIADWRVSLIFMPDAPTAGPRRAPDWQRSGWAALRRQVDGLARGRRAAP